MVNFYNHKRALQTIANKLSAHIGSGDKAHLPADRQHAGFMTPDQLASLRQSLGERTHLAPKTDIFKLAPGNYWGSDFINSSEPSGSLTILMIDVSQRDDGLSSSSKSSPILDQSRYTQPTPMTLALTMARLSLGRQLTVLSHYGRAAFRVRAPCSS